MHDSDASQVDKQLDYNQRHLDELFELYKRRYPDKSTISRDEFQASLYPVLEGNSKQLQPYISHDVMQDLARMKLHAWQSLQTL